MRTLVCGAQFEAPRLGCPGAPFTPDSRGTQAKKGVARGDTPKPDPTHHLAWAWTKSIPVEGGVVQKIRGRRRTTLAGAGVRGRHPELGCELKDGGDLCMCGETGAGRAGSGVRIWPRNLVWGGGQNLKDVCKVAQSFHSRATSLLSLCACEASSPSP